MTPYLLRVTCNFSDLKYIKVSYAHDVNCPSKNRSSVANAYCEK